MGEKKIEIQKRNQGKNIWLTLFILRPTTGQVRHKAFLKWVRTQGWSPHTSGSSKNASDHVGILFGAPQAPGKKPNPSDQG